MKWGSRPPRDLEGRTLDWFKGDELMQDAVVRCPEVVGEASGAILRLDPEFEARYPALELSAAYPACNRTSHGYGSIALETVGRSATASLPRIVEEARRVLREREGG